MNAPIKSTTTHPEAEDREGGGIFIGRFLGIRFYLDYSWFFIAAMLSWVLATRYFPSIVPGMTSLEYGFLGFGSAMLFFISILLHELGHSVVSQRCGIPVPRITLLFIGGVAEISREPDDPKSELKIAIGGPVVSLILGVLFLTSGHFLENAGLVLPAAVLSWLGMVNFSLLIFNAFPGYPLDGGRVLRALIWWKTGDVRKATYWSSRLGIGFSWFLIVAGIALLFQGNLFNGFIFIFIGMFLRNAAEAGYQHTLSRDTLEHVLVADVMAREPICISGDTPLNLAVDDFFLEHHHVGFPVCDHDRRFLGILRLEHLKSVERAKWPYTTAQEVAAGQNTAQFWIAPTVPASEALRRMLTPGLGRLAVVENERVVGFVTRHDLTQYIRVRAVLDASE